MYTLIWRRIYGFYWLTSVEINKHKIFDANNAWITDYSFRNPPTQKKNIIWVIYRIKQLRNYKKTRGPQLDKQRWRARLGILGVNTEVSVMWRMGMWRQRYYASPVMTGAERKRHASRRFVTPRAVHVLRSANSNLLSCSVSKGKIRRSNMIRIQ